MNKKIIHFFMLLSLIGINLVWANTTLTVGNGAEPVSLDPHLFRGTAEAQILKDLFEGLVVQEGTDLKPGNAARWKILDHGLRYQFELKPDLKWSDGSPLTAYDYVYSFRRAIDPATGSSYSWYFRTATIKNSAEILTGKQSPDQLGVVAVNAQLLEIHLEKPVSYFLKLLDFPIFLPVPESAITKYGSQWARPDRMLSNGAYQLKEWRINDKVVIQRNSYYHRNEDSKIDQVTYLPIVDQNAEMSRYLAGEIDITLGIPLTHYDKLKKEHPDELIDMPRLALNMVMFNVNQTPVSNSAIRKALSYSIDRSRLVQLDPSHHSIPLYALTPPATSGSKYEMPLYGEWSQDKREEEAKRLYKEAGFNEGNPLRITLLCNNKISNDKRASIIAYMWGQVLGAQVTVERNEWAVYVDRMLGGKFQVVMSPWLGAYNDPSAFMDLMFGHFKSNATGFNNPEYNKLVENARVARTIIQRQASYRQANKMLDDEMPVAPLHTIGGLRLVSLKVKGYPEDSPSGFFLSRQLEIRDKKTGTHQ